MWCTGGGDSNIKMTAYPNMQPYAPQAYPTQQGYPPQKGYPLQQNFSHTQQVYQPQPYTPPTTGYQPPDPKTVWTSYLIATIFIVFLVLINIVITLFFAI